MSKPLTIGQVAAAIGLSAHTLRYYEQAGLLRSIGRSASGHRLYSPTDLEWLRFVMRLKATGMSISDIRSFSELRALGSATYVARSKMLSAHRDAVVTRAAEVQGNLAAIIDKIAWYEKELANTGRHDETFPLTEQEKDSSWISRQTAPKVKTIDTREGGKS